MPNSYPNRRAARSQSLCHGGRCALDGVLAFAHGRREESILKEPRPHDVAACSEQPGGTKLIPLAEVVRDPKNGLLDLLKQVRRLGLEQREKGGFERRSWLGSSGDRDGRRWRGRRDTHRTDRDELQFRGRDETLAREDQTVLHGILELADVARPSMGQELFLRVRGEPGGLGASAQRMCRQEMLREREDVDRPIPQRRNGQVGHVKPVEEVLPKAAFSDGLREIRVGRRDEPYVDGNGAARPDAHHLALLKHAKQLHLRPEGQVGDLVEKERSPVGGFEPSGVRREGAGERRLLVPEQLALDQRR